MNPVNPMIAEFMELVRVEAHSRRERAIADILKVKLADLGCQVEEDDVGQKIGGEAGNLIARLPGNAPGAPAILFSAHMDRVPNHGHITPIINEAEGKIVSDGTSILAADDVSGICAVLEALRRIRHNETTHGEIEIVFSVAEEDGLLGARYLDYSRLKSKIAYVLDTSGPVGTIVNQAPTQYTMKIAIHGKSAHAGMEPEAGLSAIRVAAVALSRLKEGRLSPISTSNFGVFKAGQATNIVCELAEIEAEARSTDDNELRGYLDEVKRVFTETAAEFGAGLDWSTNLEYSTFKVDEADESIQLAKRAMARLGLTARIVPTGGGSDGNFFNAHGISAVGISPGYDKVHTPREEQSITELEKCADVVSAIIAVAAI